MVAVNAVLVRALCGSALLHCAVAAWLPGGGDGTPPPGGPPVLQAALAPLAATVPDPVLFTISGPSPIAAAPAVALADMALLDLPPARAEYQDDAPGSALDASGPGGAPGSSFVEAELLTERLRVGPLLGREMAEFPVEIGTPVQPLDRIAVPYPTAALREGREDDVVVWIVVDAQGRPEEVQVTEGSPEFADAVVAAVSAARFVPATDKREPIRFPIALHFHFTAPSLVASRTAAAAQAVDTP